MGEMAEVLHELAAKLGTTVEQLGVHAVEHTRLMALFGVVGGAFALLVSAVWWVCLPKIIRRVTGTSDTPLTDAWVMFGVVGSLIAVVITGVGLVTCLSSIPDLLEPVGATLKALR